MRKTDKIVLAIIILGIAGLIPLQMLIDRQTGNRVAEESLYLPSGNTVKKLSIGFDGMLSDVYWIRSVQYFGGKVVNGGLKSDSSERFDLLYPLLDITTTLDPQYIVAYQFGGMFVADYGSKENAIKLLERGIQANPNEWRLQQYLGLIYWREKDYQKASDAFKKGSEVASAPAFMRVVAAQMLAEGGSRSTARQLFLQVYNTTDDKQIKDSMAAKLDRLYALDQIDCLGRLVTAYKTKNDRYPASLNRNVLLSGLGDSLQNELKSCEPNLAIKQDPRGMLVDPAGYPFAYNNQTGEIALSDKTTMTQK
jgi:tetratricopeptide (TPR) repeat protein